MVCLIMIFHVKFKFLNIGLNNQTKVQESKLKCVSLIYHQSALIYNDIIFEKPKESLSSRSSTLGNKSKKETISSVNIEKNLEDNGSKQIKRQSGFKCKECLIL